MMTGVSVVMYTGNYVSRSCESPLSIFVVVESLMQTPDQFFSIFTDPLVQEKREEKRTAMKEYYEKHGGGDHH